MDDFKAVLRQVQLTMFSSQQHRRALGLEDGPVFGATLNKNILQFYVSNWEDDTVVRILMSSLYVYSLYVGCTTGHWQIRPYRLSPLHRVLLYALQNLGIPVLKVQR